MHAAQLGQHAVVIGASLAGLVAARVLAEHFDDVAVLERDVTQTAASPRAGVPQGRHAHLLNLRGQLTLAELFPGLEAQLDQVGAPAIHWMSDTRIYIAGGWLQRQDLNLTTRTLTRPALERIVRQELTRLPNVRFVEHCQASGLNTAIDRTQVTGVDVSYRRGDTNSATQSETLAADLVVAASGRSSRLPVWLKALGYEPPAITRVDPQFAYASCLYRRLSFEPDWKLLVSNQSAPHLPRMAAVARQEDEQWMVTLGGYGRSHQPPGDPDGFLAFAQSLPTPDIFEALKSATPITDISRYANTASVWRHYEVLSRLPAGLIVLGDALCCFNPVYGQGMTMAALAAATLRGCLVQAGSVDDVGSSYFRRISPLLTGPWQWATGGDLQFPETEGRRPGLLGRMVPRYIDRLLEAMHDDVQLEDAFLRVLAMLKPAQSLFSPILLLKVLSYSAKGQPRQRL